MGRYYYTANNDFDGKFWFGVQSSDDPGQVYGMRENGGDDTWIDYYADDNDTENIMNELDHQFSELGVPKNERRYRFENGNDVGRYVWEDLLGYFLCDKEKKDTIPYGMGDDQRMWPISHERVEAASRVDLGLRILNDIRLHGESNLGAEL